MTQNGNIQLNGNLTINNTANLSSNVNIQNNLTATGQIYSANNKIYDNSNGSYVAYTNNTSSSYFNFGKTTANDFIISNQGGVGVSITKNNNSWTALSDRTLKKNIKYMNSSVDKIMRLKPCKYNWKYEEDIKQKTVGFIADEVEEVLDEVICVRKNEDGDNYKGICLESIIPYIVNGIKEQNNKLNLLKQEERVINDMVQTLTKKIQNIK
jgi:hypothetical protein